MPERIRGLGEGHGVSGFVRTKCPWAPPRKVLSLAGGLAPELGGRLAAELLPRQASRQSRRFIFILAPAAMCPANLVLGQPWSGTQPGSVFNFGSVVTD